MPISDRQKKILAFPYSDYRAIICDGAVRSGKTSICMIAFIDWAMRKFNNQRFGICGKTFTSCVENILKPYLSLSYSQKKYTLKWRRSEKILEVRRGPTVNWFEFFGGKDESSAALIQGRTLAGVLLDEVVLMPESFVNQALARCSVNGARLWFSCNPSTPNHWFYKDWIKRRKERNALYLHFSMEDNPSLSKETLENYKNTWTGAFYQRYVLGEWVAAEGLVYPQFDNKAPTISRDYTKYYISMDFGTENPTAMILWGLYKGVWYAIREFYHSGRESNEQKSITQYHNELVKLASGCSVEKVIVDPSATPFIVEIQQHKNFKAWKAKNDVLDGINRTNQMLLDKKIMFNDCCTHTLEEFSLYRWDDKADEDKVIKEFDHCLTGDTLVDTTGGQFRIDELAEKLDVPNRVYCTGWQEVRTGKFYNVRMTNPSAEVYEIFLSDGRSFKATSNHPVLTRRGWQELKEIWIGERIACISKKTGTIEFVKISDIRLAGNRPVYNMEVEEYHNFSINGGIIVHNCMDAVRYFVNTTGIWRKPSTYKSIYER